MNHKPFPVRAAGRSIAAALAALLLLGACSSGSGSGTATDTASSTDRKDGATSATTVAGGTVSQDTVELYDAGVLHDVEVTVDPDTYDEMIATFSSSGEKEWIEATVTIDGATYERVGLRLKGNSSLRSLGGGGRAAGGPGGSASAEDPESLPWLIRLDKFVDGQAHQGHDEIVIRGNNSQTSLNEAVALELIGLAGEPTQKAFSTRFSVNGSDEALRLAIENPDGDWEDANFDGDGALYKAESSGDYSYRGTDPDSYTEIFDQETNQGTNDLTPLIEFLDFINNSTDTEFARELGERLDVEAFARYLALQELAGNFDDIDGPGNNSYLRYSTDTGRFTVVSWDMNLAFGGLGGGGGGGFRGAPSTGSTQRRPGVGGGRAGGPGGRSNILLERFKANATFAALYEETFATLKAELFTDGTAAEVLERWTTMLKNYATDLVPATTIDSEASTIATAFD